MFVRTVITYSRCEAVKTENGTNVCLWDYSGLGIDYQILAGPSFMAVFTVAGVVWGVAADRFNRVHLLTVSTLIFSVALACTALATTFWHLVLCRVLLGIG
jgi:MFS family permease